MKFSSMKNSIKRLKMKKDTTSKRSCTNVTIFSGSPLHVAQLTVLMVQPIPSACFSTQLMGNSPPPPRSREEGCTAATGRQAGGSLRDEAPGLEPPDRSLSLLWLKSGFLGG